MTTQEADVLLWLLARATGIASFLALFLAILSGIALRTSVLDRLGSNREIRSLHEFSSALWIPLGAVHLVSILADRTARIRPVDLVVPFGVDYGPLAVGLGTLAFDIFVIVAVTSWVRRGIDQRLWSWIHRTSYVAFAFTFAHAFLSGTDFNSPVLSAVTWSLAFAVAVLAVSRVLWGLLPT